MTAPTNPITTAEPVADHTPPVGDLLLHVHLLESRVHVLEQTVRDLAAALDRMDQSDAATMVRRTLDQLQP